MPAWHFIIPFYFGRNEHVLVKGGAPVRRKMSYLTQTIASIQRLGVDSRITVCVCNELSRQRALTVHPTVKEIDCLPLHLPLETVKNFQLWFSSHGSDDDIVAFNEDDQVLHVADSVKQDIVNTTQRVVFSPHRWARQFLWFRRKGRPVFSLNGHRGVLDNVDMHMTGNVYQFNRRYIAQAGRNPAYAACWFTKGSVFRAIDLTVPADNVELESASYTVFDSGVPVLKLSPDGRQTLSDFMADHLSGYDYNKRLIR